MNTANHTQIKKQNFMIFANAHSSVKCVIRRMVYKANMSLYL